MKLKIWLGRIIPLVIIALGEIVLYCNLFKWLTTSFVFIEIVLHILSILIVLNIVRTSRHLSSDLMWIILIMLFPVFGTFVYVLMLLSLLFGKTFRNIIKEQKKASSYYIQDESIIDEICNDNPDYVSQLAFLHKEGFPFYRNTDFEYYAPCENGFDVMLEELKKAKNYIFMEYFIVEEGFMFNSILSILEEKVKQGVEVRIMYDDMGSLGTLPASYAKQLEKKGIKAVSFNRISPIINTIMNHRDHRKILVIDGKVAFSGGANLADEYTNEKRMYGYWKDEGIKVEGEAVDRMILDFLRHYEFVSRKHEDFSQFMNLYEKQESKSLVVPYVDGLDYPVPIGKNAYLKLMMSAKKRLYIMTPYFVGDDPIYDVLKNKAMSGVDVRIILPDVPDKPLVYMVSMANAEALLKYGIKIYTLNNCFVHSKVMLSDDETIMGSINIDMRSFYQQFESAVYTDDKEIIRDVNEDFQKSFEKSTQIKPESAKKHNIFFRFFAIILQCWSPLM